MGKKKRCTELEKKRFVKKEQGIIISTNIPDQNVLWIQKLMCVNKLNGLIVGTKAVLRLLQRNSLSIVFLFPEKCCPPVYNSLLFWCKALDVPLLNLQDVNRSIMSPDFPVSVSYGIKRDCIKLHHTLEELVNKVTIERRKKIATNQDPTVESTANVSIETVEIRKVSGQIYHHEKHPTKRERTNVIDEKPCGFLSFNTSTENEFPAYKSVNWSKSELSIR